MVCSHVSVFLLVGVGVVLGVGWLLIMLGRGRVRSF